MCLYGAVPGLQGGMWWVKAVQGSELVGNNGPSRTGVQPGGEGRVCGRSSRVHIHDISTDLKS